MHRLVPTFVILFIAIFINNSAHATNLALDPQPLKELDVKNKLLQKAGIFDLRYSSDIQNDIESYLIRGKRTTKKIIARSQIYFPIIEKYLKAYQLPDELKYLTFIESSMDPNARSSAGAVGLWQLMPATARRYGLVINSQIDERKDPHKSTQAALKYLTFLHELLGDWTLAAAAYNCGGGGVQKAMRLGGGTDFWTNLDFFPNQTQHYIDRLAAAVYVINFYHLHNLEPAENEYFLKFTKMATVYNKISFNQISEALDIPVPVLEELNPSYNKQVVPDSTMGNYLILPKMKMERFIEYYNNMIADTPEEHIDG